MSKLIVLEGLDGAGTTSQAKRLVEELSKAGIAAHLTRQPSTGPVGRLLREILAGGHTIANASGAQTLVSQNTFGLLFAADRMDHIEREVEPALARGDVVVSDRWYHSSLAYQGTGADRQWIAALNSRARKPDLTLFLRVRAEVAANRRKLAGRIDEIFDDLPMQQRVFSGYEAVNSDLAASERIVVLDGEQSIDEVFKQIWQHASNLLQPGA